MNRLYGYDPTPRWSKNTRHLLVFQNKALPLQSDRKSTPQDTAKYCKNPVEQQREITFLARSYIKDIQSLIVRLRFLVAPQKIKDESSESLLSEDFFFIYLFFLLQTFYFHPFHSIFIRLDQCKYETLDYKECDQCISNLV